LQGRSGFGVADEQREFELEGGALAEALADGADTASVLQGDGADEEEAEAGAFDLDLIIGGGSVEAFEDALELAGKKSEAGVGDGEDGPGVALDTEAAGDVDAFGGVLHGVIEEVEDGGAQVFDVGEDKEANAAGDVFEGDGFGLEVMTEEDGGDAFGDQGMELDAGTLLDALALAELAGLEDGFDGGEEAVAVLAHDGIEALALLLVAGMCAPLAARRKRPVGVFSALIVAGGLQVLLLPGPLVSDVAMLVALYTLAAYRPRRIAVGAAGPQTGPGTPSASLMQNIFSHRTGWPVPS